MDPSPFQVQARSILMNLDSVAPPWQCQDNKHFEPDLITNSNFCLLYAPLVSPGWRPPPRSTWGSIQFYVARPVPCLRAYVYNLAYF